MAQHDLASAMLREIPLGQVELYVQALDEAQSRGASSPVAAQGGHICGGGCGGGGGHGCGVGCLGAIGVGVAGAFDVYGQSGLTQKDLEAAHEDPVVFRGLLLRRIHDVSRFIDPDDGSAIVPVLSVVIRNRT